MTKEEKIKEEWGKLMPDYTNINLNNGWSLNDFYEEDFDDNDFHTLQIYTPCKIRPKSLEGIGHNNNWIKIESEDDLPKEDCKLHVYPNYLEMDIFFFYNDELSRDELITNHTHYQPIEKPLKPLY